jgi:alpha-beta hydrolase superfamily lysophospholipase
MHEKLTQQPPPEHAPPAPRQSHWFGTTSPQVSPGGQPPQSVVRDVPQLSIAVSGPQAAPVRAQSSADVSGVQPHTFGVAPPPQVSGAVQSPQLATVRGTRQLSAPVSVPHVAPARAQNAASLSGTHAPHTFGTDEPQVSGGAQVPQSTVRGVPQPSSAVSGPQSRASRAHSAASVSGVHEHVWSVPQVSGGVQTPHDSLRAAPHESTPSSVPQVAPRRAQSSAGVSRTQPSGPPSVRPASVAPASRPPSSPDTSPLPHPTSASPATAKRTGRMRSPLRGSYPSPRCLGRVSRTRVLPGSLVPCDARAAIDLRTRAQVGFVRGRSTQGASPSRSEEGARMEQKVVTHADVVPAPPAPLRPPAHLASQDAYPRLRGTLRTLRIQNQGADRALAFTVALHAAATTPAEREVALASADLLVTGRRAWRKWQASGLADRPFDAIEDDLPPPARTFPRPALEAAFLAVQRRIAAVTAHLAHRSGKRKPFAPAEGSAWIAVHPEQDVPRVPVNVGCTPFIQDDITVRIGDRPPIDARFVRSGEIDDGSKIVLYLHGLGSRAEEADGLASELAGIDPEYVVVAPDLLSQGSTSRLELLAGSGLDFRYDVGAAEDAPSGYPFLELVEQFVVAFVDALDARLPGVKKRIVCVAGGSLGGTLGLRLSLTTSKWQPHTVAVWSPASLWDPINGDALKKHFAVEQVLGNATMPEFLDPGATVEGLVPLARARLFSFNFEDQNALQKASYKLWWSEPFLEQHGGQKDLAIADRLEHYGETYRRWQFRLAYEQLCFSFRRGGRIAKIGVRPDGSKLPLFLACGEHDNFIGAHIADRMKDLANEKAAHPGRALWIANAGHSLHDECPHTLATALDAFLREHV